MKHELEQEVLNDYRIKFEQYIKICALTEKLDQEIFDIAIKKAAGCKMMIDYMDKTDLLINKIN